MADYRNLIAFLVEHLVTKPEEAVVTETTAEDGTISIRITVASDDVGRVIGKRGATINALRTVAKATAVKAGDRIDVDINEERPPKEGRPSAEECLPSEGCPSDEECPSSEECPS